MVVIKVQKDRGVGDKWWFNQQEVQDEILLTLHSPADAIVGQYQLSVLMMSPDGRILEENDQISFHLLFNPWCKGKGRAYTLCCLLCLSGQMNRIYTPQLLNVQVS